MSVCRDIRQLLVRDDVRLVTLTGPGGTGKTRLDFQVTAELGCQFAGRRALGQPVDQIW